MPYAKNSSLHKHGDYIFVPSATCDFTDNWTAVVYIQKRMWSTKHWFKNGFNTSHDAKTAAVKKAKALSKEKNKTRTSYAV